MSRFSPHILQVLPALGTGGIEQGTVEMAEAIIAAGGRALVAGAMGPLVPKLLAIGAHHIDLPLGQKSPFAIRRNAKALIQLIRDQRVDLVHARSRAPAWAAWHATRHTDTPFVTTWHGVHKAGFPGKKRYNSVLARGARVIAISTYIATRLRDEYHVGDDRLRLIPRGADMNRFDPSLVNGARIQALAEKWQVPPGTPVVMLPGRLTRWKGQLLLLKAMVHLQTVLPDPWLCVLVGPADPKDRYVQEIDAMATRLGLRERLRFAGRCQDMPAAYALADVVAVPSLRPEPFGRVVIEAQAMGRPVIVSAQGGAMETVIPYRTGLLIPPDDETALADGLYQLLTLPEGARSLLAETARHHIAETYTTRQMQSATLAVYDELLGGCLSDRFLEFVS
ncbi:glycosyltransferase family 4 protein [Asaia prunellae]|uniref:glycosyltransferase family 4 protein n=1 Tax=Asaia prunellae TaxID=610245 RepID=UPI0004705B34|nr:glycosyltransferase family 4 protein [Asaia prunellae]